VYSNYPKHGRGRLHALLLACVSPAATPGFVVAWDDYLLGHTDVPSGLSGVVAIAAGWNHTVALTTVPPDTTPPSASPGQTPVANGNGWNNSDVTVS
jgi:hypothetical protein